MKFLDRLKIGSFCNWKLLIFIWKHNIPRIKKTFLQNYVD